MRTRTGRIEAMPEAAAFFILQHLDEVLEVVKKSSAGKQEKTSAGAAHKLGTDAKSSALVSGTLDLETVRNYLDKVKTRGGGEGGEETPQVIDVADASS
jgi:hypothetical protein